jgi:cyclic beta-1,2-glucan synthetase
LRFFQRTLRHGLERLAPRIGVDGVFREFGDDLPLRSELFSVSQLERHAEALADWHQIDRNSGPDRLLARLTENETVLLDAYQVVTEAVDRHRPISPAGEWLLDNFYLIEEQIRTARRHLPKQYSRSLPRLWNGPSAGYPRVYDLALELISHVDGRVDAESLLSFITAYQNKTPLNLGELWAIPIMMRQALIENLRRVAARVAQGTLERNKASQWADQFIECTEKAPNTLILAVADMARQEPQFSSAFVAEIARRLSGQSPALAFPITWIEQRLWEHGQTVEQLVQSEGQQQAVDQVSIGNCITSLRELDAIDWRTFVEALSIVEQALLGDPAGIHGGMDFDTRDQYRHVVEGIAKRSPLSEHSVACRAIELAKQARERHGAGHRSAHVGYFLIDNGLPELERATRMRLSITARLEKFARRVPLTLYLVMIMLIAMAVTVGVLWYAEAPSGVVWLLGGLLFVGATHLSVGIVNWLVTLMIAPHRLPRLDFSSGIPAEFNTLVAVPTMLVGARSIDRLLEGLEVRYLANRDDQLRFCLLTDFRDAAREHMPDDESLLQLAQAGIESLNLKYSNGNGDVFFLFHRPRCWNSQEQTWMGKERKRGKLGDLNALLRGGSPERFSLIVGDTSLLARVKYVITLDTDTLLPRNAARQLVGTLAHPLNHARIDKQQRVVSEGYGILQPGVATTLESGGQSWFARLSCGEPGIDPYTRAISDVYQDLFHEGSFIGKGIYDVDAFSATTENRFLENQILSHDLLEGCYARSGLVNDIPVYESYPARYNSDVSRRHRWMRGDWQISGWVLPFILGPGGRFERNPLSMLSRWKILDNLRRSVVPTILALVLLLGWLTSPPAALWTLVVLGIVLIPSICVSLVASLRKAAELSFLAHSRHVATSLGKSLLQAILSIVFLPYEAYVSLDAIVRTGIRMRLTRTRMLEWKTASDAEREAHSGLAGSYRAMWIAPAWAALVTVSVAIVRPDALPAAAPLLVMWLLAPLIAWRISWPARSQEVQLSHQQIMFLHQVSRKTWRFFDRFVGPEDHWLPPDNYQEEPVTATAHRTSPTNIGVSLLSTLAAHDFGYISAGRLIERIRNTLHTLNQLERFHGHFLNWYDTRSLQPLIPWYVSTVDSGNLLGHMLTLRAGLLELPRQPLVTPRLWDSLLDMRQILEDCLASANEAAQPDSGELIAIHEVINLLPEREPARPVSPTLSETIRLLQKLQLSLSQCAIGPPEEREPEFITWLRDLEQQCHDHLTDLLLVAPWLALPPPPPSLWQGGDPEHQQRLGKLRSLLGELDSPAMLQDIANMERHLPVLNPMIGEHSSRGRPDQAELLAWLLELRALISQACQRARERMVAVEYLVLQCDNLSEIEYDFLYDKSRRLLAIGYNVSERRRDPSFYDLLASESRLVSFVGIAQGQLEQEHWFALGRLLTTTNGQPALLSWSGSMFEYLMPLLVMPTYKNTLLDQTYDAVINRHIEYGRQRGVPWGVSESGYNLTDAHLIYQYRAFGVPGLGFKRGLMDDLVIAPYATALALMVSPQRASTNLQRMADDGFLGRYGFYEAVDYTRSRMGRGPGGAIVRSYMAHHQGMSVLSLAYVLLNKPMQRRFQSDPRFQATELLLQERIPKVAPFHPHASEVAGVRESAGEQVGHIRVFSTPHTPAPDVHLLSNGRYHVMVSNAGGGYSSWKGLAVTRWREDATQDNTGAFCFVRDVQTGKIWSTTHQPTRQPTKEYEAIFSQGRAEFRRRDSEIAIHTEIAVSPEDDIEIRRSTITNYSKVPRTIELTSYAEVVLATPAADATHPAFSNLFVQTELLDSRQAILCTRRPRSHQEQPPWMLHLLAVCGATTGKTSYETDRMKFIGRCRTVAAPEAMIHPGQLSNSSGSVLDPIVAIRLEVTLMPDETVSVDLVTGMTDTRDAAVELIDKYRDRHLADRVFDMVWTHGKVVLRQLNASEADAQLFGRLASSILYANAALRTSSAILRTNRRGQSGLWGHGISGDLPIVLLRVRSTESIQLVRQLVQAHAFWRLKGLGVDLVIWNESPEGYRQALQDMIVGLVSAGTEAHTLDHPGGIFIRRAEQMSDEDRILLQTVARAVIVDTEGTLADQLEPRISPDVRVPALIPSSHRFDVIPNNPPPRRDLVYSNGLGGFTADGREYVIRMEPGQATPAPWVNVLANATFGTVVSESGGAYSWSENAHEFRLTPWYNDPVTDVSGEAFYLRDEVSGEYWSPTPRPARGRMPYLCRHGFGYSVFEYSENGISSELWIYVAVDAPIKFAVLKVRNTSGRSRRLSATAFCEWVLGEMRAKGLMHVTTEVDPQCGALLARNPYSIEFSDRIAFLDVNDSSRSVTGDRTEFVGRNRDVSRPAAMGRVRLSGRVGAGLDPCAAIQTSFDLADGREREIVFTLGAGRDLEDVRRLVQQFRGVEPARHALEGVWNYWSRTLGAVHVETPDPAVNIMANGWLLYQTLACRYWARSGYYQSGGAFGFRDQLQDVAALVHAEPQLIREHLLRCAGRQFLEGDVQHWWHPPLGRGVRTHFSDDFLWLPLITCRYVLATGDAGVLDELVPFLEGRQLEPDEEAYYDLPATSMESGTLYEHCVRAITKGLSFGKHGLPLIGCGDWNDGMNLVGQHGRGESVWLAFFLYEILQHFSALARTRGDSPFADRCDAEAEQLRDNIERHAWDGGWYHRAYFDNGEPLGSADNSECQIDSIAQSWSVLSGAGNPERSRIAMDAVDERLVRRDHALIQLFDPPFDQSRNDPGYIKGYVPGVRENGGQYTHAAIWTVMAFAKLGDYQRAWELFAMINPIHHGSTSAQIANYKVEPYVVAADVYAVSPHIGRGGWTWYTGSASWMYRLVIESLLGLQREADRLRFAPCLPVDWKSFKLHYRYHDTFYHITVIQPVPGRTVKRVSVNGVEQPDQVLQLINDHGDHQVEVELEGDHIPASAANAD